MCWLLTLAEKSIEPDVPENQKEDDAVKPKSLFRAEVVPVTVYRLMPKRRSIIRTFKGCTNERISFGAYDEPKVRPM